MNFYQRGSALVTGIVMAAIVGVVAFGLITTAVTTANFGNEMEQSIVFTYEDNKNILSQYSLKVQEVVQVPEMMKDDFIEVYTSAMTGRYGGDGSKAMFQWLQEQNPQLDPGIYQSIQQIISSGRNEFQVAQSRLVDQRRTYQTNLNYVWTGFWLGVVGYPKIDMGDFEPITTGRAEDAFETGTEEAMQLRG